MRQPIEQMTRNNQKGFTLAELMVALMLSLIVLGAVHSVYRVQAHTIKAQEYRMEAQEYARTALDMMGREIKNLGYFPTQVACTDVLNTNGIVNATANTIQFVYDADGNGNCAGTVALGAIADENVTYTLNNAGDITRAVAGGVAQPLTGGNAISLIFAYFDANGNTTATLANIKRVSVSLTVRSRSADVQFGGLQTVAMNSNLDLRNRCRAAPPNC